MSHLEGSAAAVDRGREELLASARRSLRSSLESIGHDSIDRSRAAVGNAQLQLDRIDLRVVVAQAIGWVAPQMQARKHYLTSALPDTPVWLVADAFRLEHLFLELLDNAAKYTESSGRVSVWVRSRDQQVTVRIRDTGVGISPHLLPHVFGKSGPASEALTCCGPRPGVGLAVVRHLVAMHDGSVTADSRGCGCGSVFTVRLPRES
jgi:two-component system, sensor histidine kinase